MNINIIVPSYCSYLRSLVFGRIVHELAVCMLHIKVDIVDVYRNWNAPQVFQISMKIMQLLYEDSRPCTRYSVPVSIVVQLFRVACNVPVPAIIRWTFDRTGILGSTVAVPFYTIYIYNINNNNSYIYILKRCRP